MQMKPRLRIGIMLDSQVVPAWISKIINQINHSDFLEIPLVITNAASEKGRAKRGIFKRLKSYKWPYALFSLYQKLDYRLFKTAKDAFEPVDISTFLQDTCVIPAKPIQKGFVDRFTKQDIAQIKEARLDVLLRFGFNILRGDILKCARYGIWSFHHGDNREYRGTPPLFWEIYENNPVSGTMLQVLSEVLDGGQVIYRSSSATIFSSLYRNRNATYWKTSEFVFRRLKDLYREGEEYISSLDTLQETDIYKKKIYKTPTNGVMLKFCARLVSRKLNSLVRNFFFMEQWHIAIRHTEKMGISGKQKEAIQFLRPPKDRFYADPFSIVKDGEIYIFFEDYRYNSAKGLISFVVMDKEGNCSSPQVVLEKDYHLSYPFVFEWQGEIYLLPETRGNKTIELYRASEFPDRWVLAKVLMTDIEAVDATIYVQDGKFWLFANVAVEGGATIDELFLFFSDSLFGSWTPHPRNPIVSDVTRARPAGRLYVENGDLIRPGQDCSASYGHSISLNRIEVLSETDYRERVVGHIEPNHWFPGSLGTHTINRDEGFEVLDCRFGVLRPKWHMLSRLKVPADKRHKKT